MNPKYLPTTTYGRLQRVAEECNEVAAAISKTLRFLRDDVPLAEATRMSLDHHDPTVAVEDRETNEAWILRELEDLQDAKTRLILDLNEQVRAKLRLEPSSDRTRAAIQTAEDERMFGAVTPTRYASVGSSWDEDDYYRTLANIGSRPR